jgi:hypothetical protein
VQSFYLVLPRSKGQGEQQAAHPRARDELPRDAFGVELVLIASDGSRFHSLAESQ